MWALLGWTVFCSLIGSFQGIVRETSPGLVGVVSRAAAHKYLSTMFLQNRLIQSRLLVIQFPDAPHKGSLEHWIKELHVVRVFVPYIQMRMRDEIATITVKTRLHLSAKFFFGKHFERIDIITDVSVKTEMGFGSFWLGVVDVSFRSCHAEFKVARIISSSRLQTIKAKPIVKTVLTASLPRLLCEALQQAIRIVRVDFLSTVDAFLHVGPVASIQYQLASRPVITSAYYVFELNMILRTKNHFFIVPFSKSPIPLPSLQDNAFSLGITQDNLNVILGVLIQIPVQEFSGTPEVFSGATELTAVIAGLFSHQKCPKCSIQPPLKIAIALVGSKKIILEPSLIIIHLSVEIAFSVTSPSGALNGLFVLRANLALSTQAEVHDNKLQFSSKVTSMELILVSSEFGTIEVSGLVKWIKLLIKETYMPYINESLNIGIPLPSMLHIKMDYSAIQIMKGMLVLCL